MNLFVRLKDMETKTEYSQTIQIKSGIKINGSVLTLKEIKMILQIKKIKNKNGMVEYTLEDSNPLSGFLNRGKTFGFAVSAIPNHFYKQVEDCLKEQGIVIPDLLYEFSVKKTKTGFDYVITF